MKYAIIVPFNYKKTEFDTIKSVSENTRPLLYYQLDLLINKLGFDKVFIVHSHENESQSIKCDFKGKYDFVHPLDLEFSEEDKELYYLKSLATALSRIPDSDNELCIIGDNIIFNELSFSELMSCESNCRFTAFIVNFYLPINIKLYNSEFDSSGNLIGIDNSIISKCKLVPVFNLKGSALEFLRLKFTEDIGLGLFDNISNLSKSQDFKVYPIEPEDYEEFNTFDDLVKFRLRSDN